MSSGYEPIGSWTATGFATVGISYKPRVVIEKLRKVFEIPDHGTLEQVYREVVTRCRRKQFPLETKWSRSKGVRSAIRLYARFNALPNYVLEVCNDRPFVSE